MQISIILRKYVIMIRPGTQRRKKPTFNYTIIIKLLIISIKKVINHQYMTKLTTMDTVTTTTMEDLDTMNTLGHQPSQMVPIGKCIYLQQFL